MDLSNSRLCVFCRCLEPKDEPCPSLKNEQSTTTIATRPLEKTLPWTRKDEDLLEKLRQSPSSLCRRCSDFDILRAFNEARPLDQSQRADLQGEKHSGYFEIQEKYRLRLGLLSAFVVTPTCPLCRLIYRLIPRPPPDHDMDVLSLTPFRWYIRQDHWETVPESRREKFAVWLGFLSPEVEGPSGRSFFTSGQNLRTAMMTGEAIALAPTQQTSAEETYTARKINGMIDFDHIRKGLEHCQNHHPEACQAKFDKGLLATRMIDVSTRKVVNCPDQCDYLALSYVWGGVHPQDGALEAGTLPQTIEDAIALTKGLGKQYLWVDALCIDQSLNPTPEQAAEKAKQLGLMHLIYYCATITIFAVAGPRSDYGIPGVSRPRVPSTEEVIDGKTILTVPPQIMAEVKNSVWQSRAWTWQEDALSTRKLFLTETQYQLQCNETLGCSYHSEAYDSVPDLTWTHISGGKVKAGFVEADNKDFLDRADSIFESILSSYTPRYMTNDDDSLNAFQGALTRFGLAAYPKGFEWGMPLKQFPQSLAWIHDFTVKPKRRASFPSWSWAGWAGGVHYPVGLIAKETAQVDLVPRMIGINGKEVTLEGWVVTLDIRTDPFSELVVPGSDTAVGCITERNFKHNNTIPSGRYRCLVAARVNKETLRNGLQNQQVFLVILRGEEGSAVYERQTVITVSRLAVEGKDFMEFSPEHTTVTLK
ncbi:heterokaryon incompatibility protein-domain-containing protein [Fusarium solani]|uniref:Heterokaryon incompatibility protein-domain-containing protein n=1 Tax=Fusarium solani TaxID=169388 RepID=A0A9P9KYL8_FUSSL|nr:heterokaryon incompatibility protein-domain-containing protein [Fusarium solani]KAH7270962.1 heterokaryon incompatibility protein-domain-containing protein [Fusarium solani]